MTKINKQIYVFCDFDGTVTLKDLGDELFKVYGKFEPYNTQLKNGEISIYQYWQVLCASLAPNFNREIIQKFTGNYQVDPYFYEFTELCKINKIPFSIVSDGFAEYILPIMKRIGLDNETVLCNYLSFSSVVKPVFPGATQSCRCLCASCKRNAVINLVPDDGIIVYIGDGYSDFCAAEHSDVIFAKKHLARYCAENKIPHYNFKSFFDIKKIFSDILSGKKNIKQRRQAQLRRKDAFEAE